MLAMGVGSGVGSNPLPRDDETGVLPQSTVSVQDYVTRLCDKIMWQDCVTRLRDNIMWQGYVTILCDKIMWQDYVTSAVSYICKNFIKLAPI